MKVVFKVEANTPEELRQELLTYLSSRRTKLSDEFSHRKRPNQLHIHGHRQAKNMLDEIINFITDLEIEGRPKATTADFLTKMRTGQL